MGTRSIIMVTGLDFHGYYESTVRIYKGSDGYPTDTLRLLVSTIEQYNKLIHDHKKKRGNSKDKIPFVPMTFAHVCCREGANVYGMGPYEEEHFDEGIDEESFGTQLDLEWIYVVDATKKTIVIYGGGYADCEPIEFVKKGEVNPYQYVLRLYRDCRQQEYEEIKQSLDRLKKLGWKVNDGKVDEKEYHPDNILMFSDLFDYPIDSSGDLEIFRKVLEPLLDLNKVGVKNRRKVYEAIAKVKFIKSRGCWSGGDVQEQEDVVRRYLKKGFTEEPE